MASEWEDVPVNGGWEDVDEWEEVPIYATPAPGFEGDEYATTPTIADRNRMGIQGALALGDIIGSVPGAVAAGVAGLGTYAASGMDIDMALKAARETMNATTPSSMVRNLGEIMGNQNLVQGVDELRASKPYHELVERPFGALTMAARDIGGYITPGSYDDKERGADIAELMLFGAGAAGLRGKRGPTLQEQAYLEGLRSIEQRRAVDAAKQAEFQQNPVGHQFELPLEEPTPFRRPEPAVDSPITLSDMMGRVEERMQETIERHIAETAGPQVDMFHPMAGLTEAGREVPFRDTFPGTARTEQLRRQQESIPYEDARLAPELEQARIEQMQENTRITDMRADRPTIDFPLRQEAIDRDPYLRTLHEEATRAFDEYNRLQKWMDQYKKRPESVIQRMNEAASRIDEVTSLAETYLKEAYNVSKPDGYTGSMWLDKKTAMPIERTPTYAVGANRNGLPRKVRLNKTKAGRQRGSIEIDFLQYKRLKELKEFKGTLKERMNEHIQKVFDKIAAHTDWPYHPGDRIRSKKTGRGYLITNYNWDLKKDRPQYFYESLDGTEKGVMNADLMGDNFEKFGPPRDPFKGPGRKQAGGINFDAFKGRRDPEFERFKADLPLPLRKDAKRLYKLHQRQKAFDREKESQVYEGEQAGKVIKNIPGLKRWEDEVAPITKSPEELIPQIVNEPDIGDSFMTKLGHQLRAGGKLYGFETQNTVIRYTVQQMDNALREATRQIDEIVLNDTTGFKPKWEALKRDEFGEGWHTLIMNEGKMELTRDQLFELGLSNKQVEAAISLREGLNRVLDRVNQVRAAIGKKPLEKRLGYIPSRFLGDWRIRVLDKDGSPIHVIGASTRYGANRLREKFQQKHPEYTFMEVEHEPLHRFKDASDATAGYQALLEVLTADDPRVKALETTYAEFLQQQAYEALGFRRHFKYKKGVGGAEGNKLWEDAVTNAEEGLRSVMNYIDHALKWAETQEALVPIRQIFKDENVQATQKNAIKWSQAYIDQALGRSTRLARHIDSLVDILAENSGISHSMLLHGTREFKKWMTAWALGFWNIGFSLTQLFQVVQTIPAWQLMLKNKGAEGSMLGSYLVGGMETVKVFTPGLEHTLMPLTKDAMKHAHQYGIVKPKILEDVKSEFGKKTHLATHVIRDFSMTAPEYAARTMAYLTWVHFLYDSGMKPGRRLYETAANLTDMTMVDYRSHERAWLYKNMGIIGESANAITSYKHNYFTQLKALAAHRKRGGGLSPAIAMLSIGLILSGMMGLPGREDVDAIIRLLNLVSPERIPTTRELAMKVPDAIGFGGFSALTGLDVSGKFSTANIFPDNFIAFLQPFFNMGVDLGAAIVELIKNPDKTQAARSAQQMLPGGLKFIPEELYFTRENSRGMEMYLDPETTEPVIERKGKDKFSRALGLRSLRESKALHDNRTRRDEENFLSRKRSAIVKRAHNALLAEPDREALKEQLRALAIEYVQREGNLATFRNEILGKLTKQQRTPVENLLMEALRNPQKLKRLQENK